MKHAFCLLIVTLILSSFPAFASVYKYVDESGNVHFTDDMTNVPQEQRSPALNNETTPARSTQKEASPDLNPPAPDEKEQAAKSKIEDVLNQLNKENVQLKEKKAQLDLEYATLKQQKSLLDEERKSLTGDEQISKYNNKIKVFNQSSRAYEEGLNAYNEQVRDFNTRVTENRKLRQKKSGSVQAQGQRNLTSASTETNDGFDDDVMTEDEDMNEFADTGDDGDFDDAAVSGEAEKDVDMDDQDLEQTEPPMGDNPVTAIAPVDTTLSLDDQYQIISTQKEKVDTELERLQSEKQQFEIQLNTKMDRPERQKLEKERIALNKKINYFQEKQAALDNEIDAYNTRVELDAEKNREDTEEEAADE